MRDGSHVSYGRLRHLAVAAVGVTRLIAGQLELFGVDGADPLMYVSIGLPLAAVAMIACALPARHAAKVTPTESMR